MSWVSEWVIEYAIFLHGLDPEWRGDRKKIWHKGSLGDEDDARTSNVRIACVCAEKVRDTPLDDEKYNLCNGEPPWWIV